MKDRSGVAITKEGDTVAHVLYNFRLLLSNFLKRECNKGFMECLKFPTFTDSMDVRLTFKEFKKLYNYC